MTNSAFIALRDTISKQVTEYPSDEAHKWLDHPVFGLRLEEVNSAKPEVLSQPFIFDSEGEKHIIENDKPSEEASEEGEVSPGYDAFTKADLIAEIEARNEDRSDEDFLDVNHNGNKADIIAVLEADDAKATD